MRKRRGGRWSIIFLCCTLAVPTVAAMAGMYGPSPTVEQMAPAIVTGMLLGLAHLLLRPVLRVLFAPLGCLTLGLFGLVIDVGLLYGCAHFVRGFALPGPLYALLTAMLINAVCAVVGARK